MYKKMFIYSIQERKRHGIAGLFGEIMQFVMLLPVMGLIASVVGYLYHPLTGTQLTVTFSAITVMLLFVLILRIIRYTKENVTTYAVDDKGYVNILNMSKSAASYMNLQSAISNMNGEGNKKIKGMMAAGAMVQETVKNINNDDEIENSLLPGKIINKIDRVVSGRKKLTIYGDISGRKKITIRKVYADMDILEEYINVFKSGEGTGEFNFYRKYTEEDFIAGNSHNIWTYSLRWILIVVWFAIFTLSSDINVYARIKAGDYLKTQAVVRDVTTQDKKRTGIVYEADGKKIKSTISISGQEYQKGDKVDIYYSEKNNNKFILKSRVGFHMKPYLIIGIFGEAVIIFVNKFFTNK